MVPALPFLYQALRLVSPTASIRIRAPECFTFTAGNDGRLAQRRSWFGPTQNILSKTLGTPPTDRAASRPGAFRGVDEIRSHPLTHYRKMGSYRRRNPRHDLRII